MIASVSYDTIHAALDDKHGAGGWFWYSYDDGTARWFPCTITQDEALQQVHGNGYLATWSRMDTKVNGPIGGPRGCGG